ncbi:MAG: hypothetical protein NTZ39_08775 [Methanoregula sp.]|nr:hypothetical protein [Methanoregula sp.]
MNRLYFGDTRDLFKFDLVRHIVKSLPDIASFTFVPMLTEPAGRGGRSTHKDLIKALEKGKAGSQNRDLVSCMERLQGIDKNLEYFNGIRSYFEKEQIQTEIFFKTRFSHETRNQYFENIAGNLPVHTLISVDPDTGLEESTPDEKHLLFSEAKKIHDRMDPGSILMIYQHLPRVKREGYIQNRCSQLATLTGSHPAAITDNEIVFFFVTKNQKLQERLIWSIESYANSYPDLKSYP